MMDRVLGHVGTADRCGRRSKNPRKIGGVCTVCAVANDYAGRCNVRNWEGRSSQDLSSTLKRRERSGERKIQRNVLEGAQRLSNTAPLRRRQANLLLGSHILQAISSVVFANDRQRVWNRPRFAREHAAIAAMSRKATPCPQSSAQREPARLGSSVIDHQ